MQKNLRWFCRRPSAMNIDEFYELLMLSRMFQNKIAHLNFNVKLSVSVIGASD